MTLEQLRKMYKEAFGQEPIDSLGEKQLVEMLGKQLGIDGEEKSLTMTEKQLQESVAGVVGKELKEVQDQMTEMKKEFERKALSQRKSDSEDTDEEIKAKVGKMFKAIAKGDMVTAKGLSEGTDDKGGFLVHEEFIKKVIYVAESYGIARKNCLNVPMGSEVKNVSALAGGVVAYWTAEGAKITASDPTFGTRVLTAKKLAGICVGTSELIEDAEDANVFSLVVDLFAEAFAYEEDVQLFNGDGTIFTGILAETGTNVVAMPTGATAFTDLTGDDIINLIGAPKTKYEKGGRAKLYFNKDILTHLRKLKDSAGQYLWQPGLDGKVGPTIAGASYELADMLPGIADTAADKKFIVYADLKYVAFGDRRKVSTKLLTEGTVGAINLGEQDQSAVRLTERVAITALITEALSILKTSAT